MNGIEQSAILLMGVGEEQAAEILKHLPPKQIQKIGKAMSDMSTISRDKIRGVLDEFLTSAEQQTSLGVNSEEYIKKMLVGALGEDRATNVIDNILEGREDQGLESLGWMDARQIADVFRHEHPQVIATMLMYLDSEQAADVLSFISDEKHVDLLMRMSSIESIKPDALAEIANIIEHQNNGGKPGKSTATGGIKSVADLVNCLDSAIESKAIEALKNANAELCEQIQELMFIFENLTGVDDRAIQKILGESSTDTLLLALKGADEAVQEKIFKNMSKRAEDLLRDDLDAKGPVRVSEVEAAQKEILAVARRLAEAGVISLGNGSDELI